MNNVCVINTTRLIPWLRKMGIGNKLPNNTYGIAVFKAISIAGGWSKSNTQIPSIWKQLGLEYLCNKYGNPVFGWEYYLPQENYEKFMNNLFSFLNEWNDHN